MKQAKVQNLVLSLLRESTQPVATQSLNLARGDYAKSNVDYPTVLSALREMLQTELQIAQVEAEVRKAHSLVERSVGLSLVEAPPSPEPPPPAHPPSLS